MYLTTQNAAQYKGKTLDAIKRFFHAYPLTVVKRDGAYFYRDKTGTLMRVPEERDAFNNVWFDFVVEEG